MKQPICISWQSLRLPSLWWSMQRICESSSRHQRQSRSFLNKLTNVKFSGGSERNFWIYSSSLQILYSLCVEYMARKVHRADLLPCHRHDSHHRYSTGLFWTWRYLTSSSGMVILLFAMQSYLKSSTSLENGSVKTPPQTLDSCKFCWKESSGSKFNVVYEVRRILDSPASIFEFNNDTSGWYIRSF